MPKYHVRFFKEVTSDTGQDFDAVQATLDVDAANEEAAIDAAKAAFCRARGIRDWHVNAERIEIELSSGDTDASRQTE